MKSINNPAKHLEEREIMCTFAAEYEKEDRKLLQLGGVGAGGHRHILVLVCGLSPCTFVSRTVPTFPLDG